MGVDVSDFRESKTFLNLLLNNIVSAIFIVDKDAKIHAFNDSFRILFEKEEDEILGQYCGNALGCAFAVENNTDCGKTAMCGVCVLKNSIVGTLQYQKAVSREKFERHFYINGKKTVKYLQFTTRFIQFHNEPTVLIIVDDITELELQRKQLELQNMQLVDLHNQKNEFLGIAAHDLRSPMGAIQSIAHLLQGSLHTQPLHTQKELLQVVHESSKYALDLLNDLLDITKIETGNLDLDIKKQNFIGFINKSVEFNRVFAEQKDINIVVVADENLPSVPFDEQKMKQVINNLLGNAIKFSFSGARITVQVSTTGEYVETKVIDQGVGIPEDELPYVFQAFRRSQIKATAGEKSTGLGLAIAQKIILKHGGEVAVESQVRKGSTFSFKLPLEV